MLVANHLVVGGEAEFGGGGGHGEYHVAAPCFRHPHYKREPPATGGQPAEPGASRTVLFTDVEGSTALTQRLGDAKARELLREHERMVREQGSGGSTTITAWIWSPRRLPLAPAQPRRTIAAGRLYAMRKRWGDTLTIIEPWRKIAAAGSEVAPFVYSEKTIPLG